MKYDVVIIGAGPGGLNCAQTLSKSKKSVLLLEQKTVIGPKICAGGLTGHDLEYLDLPSRLLDFKYKSIRVRTPKQNTVMGMSKEFVYTIDRKRLGQWQLRKLKKTNVEIRTGVKVVEIGKNYVILDTEERVEFKYLIGADGSNSIVRKHLGLKMENVVTAMQYIIKNKKLKELELVFDSKLFDVGYAWVFPHSEYVSVGCGCDSRYLSAKKLRNNFHKWLKVNKINVNNGEFQSHPINYDYKGYKFNKIFLVGDAAGFASGFTGEGMYYALISGEEVAKKILNPKYTCKKIEEILEIKKKQEMVMELLEKSGSVRALEFEFIQLVLKARVFNKSLLNLFCP
ncbi:NAD(P)/FAD-dependent oxidoreductase [archaeon]|jgi:geranylgeranyl reductase family protein|nr:NAD(P)/FAD-dependent oxidoreductase [archaeon]MBT4396787.1 NAD(P)/FAD-dependent oxidoreductase [archaeon]